MIRDSLSRRPIPTVPDDLTDPVRFGQPMETTKDVFIIEFRKFFNRSNQTASMLEELPTIRKFDISFNPTESSQETAVNLIQKYPDITEHLPLIAVLGATGRNYPMSMGLGGSFVDRVMDPPTIISTNAEPYALIDGQTIIYKTTSFKGVINQSTIILRASRFANIAQATAEEVIEEVNFQALYASGAASNGKVALSYGGPSTSGVKGNIEIVGGTALTALGFTVGQKAEYKNFTSYNRYIQSTSVDVALEVVSEDHNIRTELTDLLWNFFTYQMNDRSYMFLGRSTFDTNIKNETYQIVLKPDPSMSGEQEIPRPGDESDKLYVNRVNVSVTTMQFIDKAVLKPGTTTPMYLGIVEPDDGIPQKN